MTTWRQEIEKACRANGELYSDIIEVSIDKGELDREFDGGYGLEEGKPFAAWSENYVYFPVCYDGYEWVGSAPRNPCNKKLYHQGG